jgi:MFS family permease
MEAAGAGRRGFAVSWQPASQQVAATVGALVGVVLSQVMTSEALDSYGWRIAFLIGAITLPREMKEGPSRSANADPNRTGSMRRYVP